MATAPVTHRHSGLPRECRRQPDPQSRKVRVPRVLRERRSLPCRSRSSSTDTQQHVLQPSPADSRHASARRTRTRARGSLGRRARLEDDDRRFSRASCGVTVEVLVQFTPALPQAFTLAADCGPAEHLAPDPPLRARRRPADRPADSATRLARTHPSRSWPLKPSWTHPRSTRGSRSVARRFVGLSW
jgi:hypothetical protein